MEKNIFRKSDKKIPRQTIRNELLKIKEYKCKVCGIDQWRNKAVTLAVDHIDGDSYNNEISNLRFLCPNCHSQTKTFCVGKKKKFNWKRGNKNLIIKTIKESLTYNEVLCKLKLSTSSSSYESLKNFMIDNNISLFEKSKKILYDVCHICKKIKFESEQKTCSRSCASLLGRKNSNLKKINWDNIELEKLLIDNNFNFSKVAKMFNITDNAVRKRAKKIGVIHK